MRILYSYGIRLSNTPGLALDEASPKQFLRTASSVGMSIAIVCAGTVYAGIVISSVLPEIVIVAVGTVVGSVKPSGQFAG
jgi:hypothetical protein